MAGSRRRGAWAPAWIGAASWLLVPACNFQIAAPSYLNETKLISIRGSVREVGPLNPGRIGASGTTPVAETMPGDEFTFEAVVVDTRGQQLDAAELDSLWFQCGDADCYGYGLDANDPSFERDCDALESPNLDELCRVARGDGTASFVVGPLGPSLTDSRVATFYGVVAWNGRSAESCWEARKSLDIEVDDCAFVHRPVKIGPSWWMLAYAETVGFESPIPIVEFPAPVFGQLANRVPIPDFEVYIDDALVGRYPDTASFVVSPGSSIRLELGYDLPEQLLQAYFLARQLPDNGSFWFTAAQEIVTDSVYTSESIHTVGERLFPAAPVELVVDEYAETGHSRVMIVYRDDRYGEGLAELDFDIESGG